MSIQDTINNLKDFESKMQQVLQMEEKAKEAQRKATSLRDEADRKLRETQKEKSEVEALLEKLQYENKKEESLRLREANLQAKMTDFDRLVSEKNKEMENKQNELVRRVVAVEKMESENKRVAEELLKTKGQYESLAKMIKDSL